MKIRAGLVFSILLALLVPTSGKSAHFTTPTQSSTCSMPCCHPGASHSCCASDHSVQPAHPFTQHVTARSTGCNCQVGQSSGNTTLGQAVATKTPVSSDVVLWLSSQPDDCSRVSELALPGILGADSGPPPRLGETPFAGRAPPFLAA